MKTQYCVSYAIYDIYSVNVVDETRGPVGVNPLYSYHDTWEKAKNHLIDFCVQEIHQAELRLSNVKAMEEKG